MASHAKFQMVGPPLRARWPGIVGPDDVGTCTVPLRICGQGALRSAVCVVLCSNVSCSMLYFVAW